MTAAAAELEKNRQNLKSAIARAGWRVWRQDLTAVILLSGCLGTLSLILMVVLDHLFLFSPPLRYLAAALTILPGLIILGQFIIRRSKKRVNRLYLARELEKNNPQLHNSLITALQSSEPDSALLAPALAELDPSRLVLPTPPKIKKGLWCLLFLLYLLLLYTIASVQPVGLAIHRILCPWKNLSAPTRTRIRSITPNDKATLMVARPLPVRIRAEGVQPSTGSLQYRLPDGVWTQRKLIFDPAQKIYYQQLPAITGRIDFRVQLGDAQSPLRQVQLYRRVGIEQQRIRHTYPSYLHRPSKEKTDRIIRTVRGTRLGFSLDFDQPVHKAVLLWTDGEHRLLTNGRHASLLREVTVDKGGFYRFRLWLSASSPPHETTAYPIQPIPDLPPQVELLEPENDLSAFPNSRIRFLYNATDDFQLKKVQFVGRFFGKDSKQRISLPIRPRTLRITGKYDLRPDKFKARPGDRLVCYIRVRDANPQHHFSYSKTRVITIISPPPPAPTPTPKNTPPPQPPKKKPHNKKSQKQTAQQEKPDNPADKQNGQTGKKDGGNGKKKPNTDNKTKKQDSKDSQKKNGGSGKDGSGKGGSGKSGSGKGGGAGQKSGGAGKGNGGKQKAGAEKKGNEKKAGMNQQGSRGDKKGKCKGGGKGSGGKGGGAKGGGAKGGGAKGGAKGEGSGAGKPSSGSGKKGGASSPIKKTGGKKSDAQTATEHQGGGKGQSLTGARYAAPNQTNPGKAPPPSASPTAPPPAVPPGQPAKPEFIEEKESATPFKPTIQHPTQSPKLATPPTDEKSLFNPPDSPFPDASPTKAPPKQAHYAADPINMTHEQKEQKSGAPIKSAPSVPQAPRFSAEDKDLIQHFRDAILPLLESAPTPPPAVPKKSNSAHP